MKKTLLFLMLVVCLALSGCGKSEAIINAEEAIEAIGEVTLESSEMIQKAEEAVNALSAEDKKKFKKGDELEEIKNKYNQLVEEDKVQTAIKLIDEIGEVTLDSKEKINEAEKAYNKISVEFQEKVTNKNKLDEAISALDAIKATEKENIITAKTPAFNVNHDKVENITWYEPKNMPRYIDIRSYIIPYIGKQGENYWICTRYNYTADDWIFWENLNIVVDGEKYYKSVGRSNIVRDNDTEVWEYYDEALSYNLDMDNSDLKMLKAIADSNETIIRFQGDEYHYDLYVTAADKKMIADVLELYQVFIW